MRHHPTTRGLSLIGVAVLMVLGMIAAGCSGQGAAQRASPDLIGTATEAAGCGNGSGGCVDGKLCQLGSCVETCAAGYAACPVSNASYCAALPSDSNNCGACGNVCPSGQNCVGGACTCPSATPQACGSGASAFCTNGKTDPFNCGACGVVCSAGFVCSDGACAATCSTGYAACAVPPAVFASYCANEQIDVNNCGACGNACPAGQDCAAGSCSCPSMTPDPCGTGGAAFCTSLQNDTANCGTCGSRCGAGLKCSGGTCAPSCMAPELVCPETGPASYCANFGNDPDNCGGCGLVCAARNNATPVCVTPSGEAPTCSFTCKPGFLDVDRNAANGCEADSATDPSNCGGYKNQCPGAANAAASCSGGTCGISCNPGFADCNHLASDGCEINLQGDGSNCGACGRACPASAGFAGCIAGQNCAYLSYVDEDGDGYAKNQPPDVISVPATATQPPSPPSGRTITPRGTDCYDQNAAAHPGAVGYFGEHRGDGSFDYDCDGTIELDPEMAGTQTIGLNCAYEPFPPCESTCSGGICTLCPPTTGQCVASSTQFTPTAVYCGQGLPANVAFLDGCAGDGSVSGTYSNGACTFSVISSASNDVLGCR